MPTLTPTLGRLMKQCQPCKHCGTMTRYYRRRLCRRCHEDKSVRDRFVQIRNTGSGAYFTGVPQLPPKTPFLAAPGSEEKIRIMMDRAEKRQELTRPDERRWYGE